MIYTGAVPSRLDLQTLRGGEVELQRATRVGSNSPSSVGITRWQHDSVSRVGSGVTIRFDAIVEATGGRSGLRETLVGKENVVSIHDIGKAAANDDPSLKSYFDDPEDHTAEYVESDYGCPAGLLPKFAATLLAGNKWEIPDGIFRASSQISTRQSSQRRCSRRMGHSGLLRGSATEIWLYLTTGSCSSVVCQINPEPATTSKVLCPEFRIRWQKIPSRDALDRLNPVSLLVRILYAMGVPFDAVDRRQLVEFYTAESFYGDASDIVSTWIGKFRGLRVGLGAKPIWRGLVPGSKTIDYGIIGESLQNAWYRFGVGVDDLFRSAAYFATGLELAPDACLDEARRLERVMRSRSVRVPIPPVRGRAEQGPRDRWVGTD